MPLSDEQLSKPIDASAPPFDDLLADLQGNILKGHGRELTANIFLRFTEEGRESAKAELAKLARDGTILSAKEQLRQVRHFHAKGVRSKAVAFAFLSAAGYKALDLTDRMPNEPAFAAGMASRTFLDDPAPAGWDAHLRDVHGLILIGDENAKGLDMAIAAVTRRLRAAKVAIAGIELGRARFNEAGDGIEHFGYVDGRSQPLLLESDLEKERGDKNGGTAHWDPAFSPLATVLVRDPGGTGPDSFGSLFVFRKLEQNVRGFKRREQELADALNLGPDDEDRELAGALVVGRFEDGTPVVKSRKALGAGVPNDFNYDADPDGLSCPFQAHIRKTNPRGDVQREFHVPNRDGDRRPIMARRGIPFGVRSDDGEDIDAMPEGGVGLLFMAYQRSFVDQFEFTQKSWAGNENFVRRGTGIDPVIGQGPANGPPADQQWRAKPGDATTPFSFAHFVAMKGGEYFFAPSISFLASLGPAAAV